MSNDNATAGNQGGDALTGNEPPTGNDGTAGADAPSGDASATDSTAVGDTDLGLGGNEDLRTGAASDQARAATDQTDAATGAQSSDGADPSAMSSMETPDAEDPRVDEDADSAASTAANPDDGTLKDGVPSAEWLPENAPPTTSGPVP